MGFGRNLKGQGFIGSICFTASPDLGGCFPIYSRAQEVFGIQCCERLELGETKPIDVISEPFFSLGK